MRVHDEHELVLVERELLDVGIVERAEQPDGDLVALDELDHLLGVARCAPRPARRGASPEKRLRIVGSAYVETIGDAQIATWPADAALELGQDGRARPSTACSARSA